MRPFEDIKRDLEEGFITINEARAELGYKPLEGGEIKVDPAPSVLFRVIHEWLGLVCINLNLRKSLQDRMNKIKN